MPYFPLPSPTIACRSHHLPHVSFYLFSPLRSTTCLLFFITTARIEFVAIHMPALRGPRNVEASCLSVCLWLFSLGMRRLRVCAIPQTWSGYNHSTGSAAVKATIVAVLVSIGSSREAEGFTMLSNMTPIVEGKV